VNVLHPLPWHAGIWATLCERALAGRLPHGLLLAGQEGIGKRHFASAFATWLLCERKPDGQQGACGECRSCAQWLAGSHPDTVLMTPETGKREIRIEQVRGLLERLSLTRHYGGHRVVRVQPAESLNINAANALLKTLEEPPEGTVFLLSSALPRSLPATVRSRVQHVRMAPPSPAQAIAWLEAQGVDQAEQRLAASAGNVMRAWAQRDEEDPALRDDYEGLLAVAARRDANPLESIARIGTTRDAVSAFLLWFASHCHRQLLAAKEGAVAERFELMLRELTKARRALDGNAHPQLLLESVMIAWHRMHHARLPAFVA
jgi:DNA polymerase-3 subunit delta'